MLSKLEKLKPIAQKTGKTLHFWLWPSSFWKYAKNYDKELFPENGTDIEIGTEKSRKSSDTYFAAGAFELLRLGAYAGLAVKAIQKYF